MSKDNKKKKHSASLLKRLFGGKSKKEEMDLMQEELLQSPFRTIVRNFRIFDDFPDRIDRTDFCADRSERK